MTSTSTNSFTFEKVSKVVKRKGKSPGKSYNVTAEALKHGEINSLNIFDKNSTWFSFVKKYQCLGKKLSSFQFLRSLPKAKE